MTYIVMSLSLTQRILSPLSMDLNLSYNRFSYNPYQKYETYGGSRGGGGGLQRGYGTLCMCFTNNNTIPSNIRCHGRYPVQINPKGGQLI